MKEIRENIKNGSYHRVYLLYGPETYLRTQYCRMLVEALVPDGDEMNFTRFAEKDTEEAAVISQAETLPFFADRRVILVENSGFFKNKTEELAAYLEQLFLHYEPSYL